MGEGGGRAGSVLCPNSLQASSGLISTSKCIRITCLWILPDLAWLKTAPIHHIPAPMFSFPAVFTFHFVREKYFQAVSSTPERAQLPTWHPDVWDPSTSSLSKQDAKIWGIFQIYFCKKYVCAKRKHADVKLLVCTLQKINGEVAGCLN